MTASAQLNFGVKGGLNVTNMSLSSDVVSKSNQAGFFIGPTMKFTVPIIGIGFDASLLYDQRAGEISNTTIKQQQVVLPVNLRYQVGLGDLASIVLFAGPQLGVNVGNDVDEINWEWKAANLSVNAGVGVMLLSHFQVTANYNMQCGKAGAFSLTDNDGKLNSWQLGLAYYF